MNILISGGCKNGKSSFAQKLVCELAKEHGSNPVYFATMIPHDGEDDERIQKHRNEREGLGFDTFESGTDFSLAVKKLGAGRVVLFDSLTALVANELFEGRTDFSFDALESDSARAEQNLCEGLSMLIQKSASVVFVSDTIFCDGKIYDKTTELYRRILSKIENFIAKKCSKVYEMSGGKELEVTGRQSKRIPKFALIIGGAYQGKTEFAKKEFSLSDDEICACSQDSSPDFSKKCLSHFENYVAFCIKNGIEPKTDFSDCTNVKAIVCDDIFCGVVPTDSFLRKMREKTGLALQKVAAAENTEVIRFFCGIPSIIKI